MAFDSSTVSSFFGVGPHLLIYILFVFLIAGVVKGVIAFGLPLITIPMLSVAMPVPHAITLSLLPVISSNIAQAYMCRRGLPTLRSIWPLLLTLVITVPVSAHYAVLLEERTLYAIAGGAIEVLVLTQLLGFRPDIKPQYRQPALLISGFLTGMVGGATSFFGFPAIQVFLTLNLGITEFALATSVTFLLGSIALGLTFGTAGHISGPDIHLSVAAVIPLLLGLVAGHRLSSKISPALFRRIALLILLATGLYLLNRGLDLF